MLLLLLAAFLLLVYAVLLGYLGLGWKQLKEFKKPGGWEPITPITVLVPARNEEKNLPQLLDALSCQDYPRDLLEVIVIDDFSTDATARIVDTYPGTRLIRLSDHISSPINSYKKKAIETGISLSRGELIVTTDADCNMSTQWLKEIAGFFETMHPSLMVMPVVIDHDRSFLSVFQSLDFMSLQGITGGSAGHGAHAMCNGANLAYTRRSFENAGGFAGIDELASGDDMLLLQKMVAMKEPVSYFLSFKALVHTSPMKSVKDFLSQRIRWASKANRYQDKRLLPILILVFLLNLLLLLIPLLCIFYNPVMPVSAQQISLFQAWIILVVIKTMVELLFLWPVAGFFRKRHLLWLFIAAQPFHILYTVVAGFLGKWGTYQWKGRNVQ